MGIVTPCNTQGPIADMINYGMIGQLLTELYSCNLMYCQPSIKYWICTRLKVILKSNIIVIVFCCCCFCFLKLNIKHRIIDHGVTLSISLSSQTNPTAKPRIWLWFSQPMPNRWTFSILQSQRARKVCTMWGRQSLLCEILPQHFNLGPDSSHLHIWLQLLRLWLMLITMVITYVLLIIIQIECHGVRLIYNCWCFGRIL